MIDLFSIVLTHGLMLVAAWRLVLRDDLDRDPVPGDADAAHGWGRARRRAGGDQRDA